MAGSGDRHADAAKPSKSGVESCSFRRVATRLRVAPWCSSPGRGRPVPSAAKNVADPVQAIDVVRHARMKNLFREPLLHFLLLGALLFAGYAAVADRGPPSSPGKSIVLTNGQIDSLAAVFERKWQRPPTPDERGQLVESFVRDEILYREGVALGLDRDDALVRRRVAQKVELLAEEARGRDAVGDVELQAYLDAHPARFEVEPRLSFRQAYVEPRPGRDLDRDAAHLLTRLRRGGQAIAASDFGDPTQLPRQMEGAPLSAVARDFGADFANALMKQPQGGWSGPVRSAFGVHLVFVDDRIPARMPTLAETRAAVERDWARDQRASASDAWYRQLRQRYTVSLEPSRLAGPP